jgi:hypothetical protein
MREAPAIEDIIPLNVLSSLKQFSFRKHGDLRPAGNQTAPPLHPSRADFAAADPPAPAGGAEGRPHADALLGAGGIRQDHLRPQVISPRTSKVEGFCEITVQEEILLSYPKIWEVDVVGNDAYGTRKFVLSGEMEFRVNFVLTKLPVEEAD